MGVVTARWRCGLRGRSMGSGMGFNLMSKRKYREPTAYQVAEEILRIHGVGSEEAEFRRGERSKEKIDAIIADIQAANGENDYT